MLRHRNHDKQVGSLGAQAPADLGAGNSRLGRRSFLKRAGLGGAALLPTTSLLMGHSTAQADVLSGGLSQGDIAILRLLAAAEILESDLWQQYQEISLGNAAFIQAIQVLDGD